MNRAIVESPIGPLTIEGNEESLLSITFGAKVEERDPGGGIVEEAARQLRAYFRKRLTRFDLPLQPEGTAFQKKVWLELRRIPYGNVISYGELAKRIGMPTASRAVGSANGSNPIPIIIPCHRVIGSDGKLTGYSGGIHIKQELLKLEAVRLF